MTLKATPSPSPSLADASFVMTLARTVAQEGGRVVVVGGWVRDQLCEQPSNDFDLEIFGLTPEQISRVLRSSGFSAPVGRHFPVWRNTKRAVDASFPRAGAALYSPHNDESLRTAFREASRHRDLTINAIGWDPLLESGDGEAASALIDPWRGREDLADRRLRMVDSETFGSDPLRVLRVVRLRARYAAEMDEELVSACRALRLDGISIERIATELRRILCELDRPSIAIETLAEVDQLEMFPPIAALREVPQDPKWHPEGDVYVHTLQVIDRAAEIAHMLSKKARERLMFAALCHDLGKPATTTIEAGRIRSIGHEAVGATLTSEWLEALRLPGHLVESVTALVTHHLAPAQFVAQGAGPRAYRKLARTLAPSGVSLVELERLARADHLGRASSLGGRGDFEAGPIFAAAAEAAQVKERPRPGVVSASDLMARGIEPGPELGRLLERCLILQDETGLEDAAALVDRVLDEHR